MIKSTQEISDELRRVTAENEALNGDGPGGVYPLDSLHAQGVLSPTCSRCCAVAALRWMLGIITVYPNSSGGGPRRTSNITQEELESARPRTRRFEKIRQPEALVNDW